MCVCVYVCTRLGGSFDYPLPQRLMNSFVNRLFTVKCFETDFHLMTNIDGQSNKHINMPEGISLAIMLLIKVNTG